MMIHQLMFASVLVSMGWARMVLEGSQLPNGMMGLVLKGDCGLIGVTSGSFVPGAQGEWMRVDDASFLGESGGSVFSVQVDVSRVPAGEAATIGFSSWGVVDSCTGTTLGLVDPLVFRVKQFED
jgi:hypothetical protein